MALTRRQKLTLAALVLYWPIIFILSHIPIPQLVYKAQVSDKILHLVVYLLLVFLVWFAICPNAKVNWRRPAVWWILLVVVWYGVLDEWLQGYVGRQPSVADFFADLVGVLLALIVLSFFTFYPAALVITAGTIFLLTNLSRTNPAELLPLGNALFHLFSYAFFAALWIRFIHHYLPFKPPQLKWILVSVALPTALVFAVKLSTIILQRHFNIQSLFLSAAGIVITINAAFVVGLVRQNISTKLGGT
jgi:VanZ family protein